MTDQKITHGAIDLALRARAMPLWVSTTAKIGFGGTASGAALEAFLALEIEDEPATHGLMSFADREGRRRELTKYQLEEGLAAAQRWRSRGLDLPLLVAIGASDVCDETLLFTIRLVLEKTRQRPSALSLIVPCEAYMNDRTHAGRALQPIANDGVGLVLAVEDGVTKSFEPLTHHPFTAFCAGGTSLWERLRTAGPGDLGAIGNWFAWAQVLGLPRLAFGLSSFRDVGIARAFGFTQGAGRHIGDDIPLSAVGERLAVKAQRALA